MRIFIKLFYIFIVIYPYSKVSFSQGVNREIVSMQDALNKTLIYNKRIQSEKSKFDTAKYRFEQATRRISPSAVIQVNIPIFNRGTEYSKVKEAKVTKASAEYNFIDTSIFSSKLEQSA